MCREKDIRMLCPADRKDRNGFTLYTLYLYIADVEKPPACNYDSPEARDEDCMRISEAWEHACSSEQEILDRIRSMEQANRSMQEAIRRTDAMLEEARRQQEAMAEEARKRPKTAGTVKKAKKRETKPFVPPTFEEVVKHILENGYEKVARQQPEGIARRFIRYYAPDGKWRFKDGRPVKDWKKCMANWINRIDEDEETQKSGAPPAARPNQFTQGVDNNGYDFDQLEEELAGSIYEEDNNEQKEEEPEAQTQGLPA